VKASDEIKAQRELLGEKVGRFEVTELDVSEHAHRGPFMVLSGDSERLVVRKNDYGLWVARRCVLTHLGYMPDDEPLCVGQTLARLLEKVREVAK
jgi:hypothetical protein